MNHKSQNVLFLTSHKFRLQLRLCGKKYHNRFLMTNILKGLTALKSWSMPLSFKQQRFLLMKLFYFF